MKKPIVLETEFVRTIPEKLKENTLYISMEYATVAHKCCCGCGLEVVTPLSPTDWKLAFDGVSVSLHPSIGNWSFPCQSHYWIDKGKVRWAGQMTQEQIGAVRSHDRHAKAHYFDQAAATGQPAPSSREPKGGFWSRIWSWWSRK